MEALWEGADAWVFASIDDRGPDTGSTLAEIIAHADGINHAILTEAEFTRAVPRLINAGLIGADRAAGRYWRTPTGQELYERRMKRHGLFGWIDAIPPALRSLGPPRDGEWELAPGEFDRALREYQRWAEERARRSRRKAPERRHS